MTTAKRLTAIAVLGLAAIVISVNTSAAGVKSDSEVKITAASGKPDSSGKQIVTITLAHNPDWHTYANPVGNDSFTTNQTLVTIKAKTKPTSIKIDYPTGKLHKDKDVGDYSVYEGKVEIKATVVRAEGDTSPLEVSVKIVACNDKKGMCLLPATVKLAVKE